MQTYEEMMLKLVEERIIEDLKEKFTNLIELKCYRVLQKIADIIRDEDMSNDECIVKIKKITIEMEKEGINSDYRHRF